MKIVLINPTSKIWIQSKTAPLGLGYIASFLISKNYLNVEIIDLNLRLNKEIPDADIYGITATTPLIYSAFSLAKDLKDRKGKVVLGGPHSTCLPEESLNQDGVDFVIRGEGELAFYELVKAIENNKGFDEIDGLSYKKDGKVFHNPLRKFVENLDELPMPAYNLFNDLKKYSHPQPLIGWRKPVVNMVTSRGCPFGCYFCYKGTFGKTWRARSPENVIKEWEYLIKSLNVKEIAIQDDVFNIDINRAKKIMGLIIKKKLNIPFTFPNGLRADLLDEELVVLMKNAGLYRVAIGVESGVQEILDDIGKQEKLEQIVEAINLFKKYKIQTIAFFVMGHPKDTVSTMGKTIEFARKLNPTFAQFTMATPFPGTKLYEIVKDSGTLKIKKWDEYSQLDQKDYFDYTNLKGETINKFVKKAYRNFYFNIEFIFKMLLLREFYFRIFFFLKGFIHFIVKGK